LTSGLIAAAGQEPPASDVRLFRISFATLRLWSRQTPFLRFPPPVDASHVSVKGAKRCGIAAGSPRGV
jgi:hypothetical protein